MGQFDEGHAPWAYFTFQGRPLRHDFMSAHRRGAMRCAPVALPQGGLRCACIAPAMRSARAARNTLHAARRPPPVRATRSRVTRRALATDPLWIGGGAVGRADRCSVGPPDLRHAPRRKRHRSAQGVPADVGAGAIRRGRVGGRSATGMPRPMRLRAPAGPRSLNECHSSSNSPLTPHPLPS